MSASGAASGLLGYLAFAQYETHGFVGGYLLVDQMARPVEFHCTAPIQPTRTQEILYGATLRSALFCDQIGKSLIANAKRKPALLLADQADALGLRAAIDLPLALFVDKTSEESIANTVDHREASTPTATGLRESWSFEIGGHCFTAASGFEEDQSTLRSILQQIGASWDLAEPLDRIREAIQEARRSAA